MPTVGIKKAVLDRHLKKVYTQDQFDELCFSYGLELDEVTSEKASAEKERGVPIGANEQLSEQEVYKIELPANRYDLLSVEGLCRALLVFNKEVKQPVYSVIRSKKPERLVIKKETRDIRPFAVAAILRDVRLDADIFASFIDLQDKLHQNIGRKRSLVSIGTHDLDTIQGPFEYRAEQPDSIRFKPLNEQEAFTASELMQRYSKDSHLKTYLHIIEKKPLYPIIYDSRNVVLSLPPIINGEHSKITLNTKNIFIEVTATDLEKAKIVLDTLVALFSEYCRVPFTVEAVEVEDADGKVVVYPELLYRKEIVDVLTIKHKIGIDLSAEEMADHLTRMCLNTTVLENGHKLEVTVPPTRHDIIHECDVAEDVAVAYGYNKIIGQMPQAHTVAETLPLNKLTDLLRVDIAAAGWTETLNFALCSEEDISTRLRKQHGYEEAVKIENPKTSEFKAARNTLIPGLLRTVAANRDLPLPLKLFEFQDVVLKDAQTDVGARNERRLAALYYSKQSGFEIIHGFLDRIMQLLDVPFSRTGNGYHIEKSDDPTFFPGRCAAIIGPGRVQLGVLGVLHPEVITAFGLTLPCSLIEMKVEPFL